MMAEPPKRDELIARLLTTVADFPKRGISFKDITTVLRDPAGLRHVVTRMVEPFRANPPDFVVGLESRGFPLGATMVLTLLPGCGKAIELGCGFTMMRKPGKLPRATLCQSFGLEYGTDSLHVHVDAFSGGEAGRRRRVVLADDLLATGGTLMAAISLAEEAQAEVVGISIMIELADLNGRAKLGKYADLLHVMHLE